MEILRNSDSCDYYVIFVITIEFPSRVWKPHCPQFITKTRFTKISDLLQRVMKCYEAFLQDVRWNFSQK